MKGRILFTICILLLFSCAGPKSVLHTKVNNSLSVPSFQNHFLGLLVYDPQTRDTLYAQNANKYFTPASNTKIVSLFTALQLLPDSLPALHYWIHADTLIVEGTGDPTPLHPYFKDSTALKFMKRFLHVKWHPALFEENKFGPGWAWDDYDQYYSPERGSLPLYGNVVAMHQADRLEVAPAYFKDSVTVATTRWNRDLIANRFYYPPESQDTLETPFITDSTLTKRLLEKVLQKPLTLTHDRPEEIPNLLLGMPADTVYTRMMEVSDNFVADQLLVMASAMLSDTLSDALARKYILEHQLADLKHPPRWVDGSGLSRYTLFTPTDMVQILEKLYHQISKERLHTFFHHWGGNLPNADGSPGTEKTYIYAKSGSLSNNYCLSGYLETRSGKTLLFSFMNNHYMEPTSTIKAQMERVLQTLYETY